MTAPDRKKLKTLNDPVDLIEDNERPSTEDVRVSDEAVRRAAEAIVGMSEEQFVYANGSDWWEGTRRSARRALAASGYPEEVRLLTAELHASGEHLVRLNERIAELEAENTRLREALAQYETVVPGSYFDKLRAALAQASSVEPSDAQRADSQSDTQASDTEDER